MARARGAYNTRQKEEVFRFLAENADKRWSLDEWADGLKAFGKAVGKTTVYRHLEHLAKQGCVRKGTAAQGSTIYQYVPHADECVKHLHAQCMDCGTLYHLDCACFDQLNRHVAREHRFLLDAKQTILMGHCARCAEEGILHGTVDAEACDDDL